MLVPCVQELPDLSDRNVFPLISMKGCVRCLAEWASFSPTLLSVVAGFGGFTASLSLLLSSSPPCPGTGPQLARRAAELPQRAPCRISGSACLPPAGCHRYRGSSPEAQPRKTMNLILDYSRSSAEILSVCLLYCFDVKLSSHWW